MKKSKLVIPVVLLTVSVACLAAACGETKPTAHDHTFATEWSHNETYHWHASNCQHSEKTSGKATHTFTETVVEPSCLTGGYVLHKCVCGYSYKSDEFGQGVGHIIVHYDARQATCSLEGWEAYDACARCGYEEGTHATYPATGNHTFVKHIGQQATHYEDGWKDYEICSTCGEYKTPYEIISSETLHEYDGDTCTVCEHEFALSQQLEFSESGATCSVTGIGSYKGAELRIPKKHNGKKVTAIANGAFKGNETIKKVIIPGEIISVGAEAFYNCKNLEEITFTSEGTTTLGIAALSGCSKLKTVGLPDSLKTIKEFAFQKCESLEEIALPVELNEIGFQAFKDCTSLTEITIPKNIELLDYNLFMNCTSLSSVTFAGNKVTNIKWQAFYGCTSLTEITLPASLSEIGQRAFEKSGLTSIVLPSRVAYIATGAFKGCKLTSAIFKTTSGWTIAKRDEVAEEDLIDAAKAAQLLTDTHADEFWKCD